MLGSARRLTGRNGGLEGPGALLLLLASLAGASVLLTGETHLCSIVLFECAAGLILGILSSAPLPYPWSRSIVAHGLGGCVITVSLTFLGYLAGLLLRPAAYAVVPAAAVIVVISVFLPLLRVYRHG